jgi:hypothetical protein
MAPFEEVDAPDPLKRVDLFMAIFGTDEATAKRQVEMTADERWFVNDGYAVAARAVDCTWGPMIHLSIKRHDKAPIHDWRDLQEIKNLLVGPEHEAIELYPAESRLVDTANQYHLWVLADDGRRFPFGFRVRFTATPEQAALIGARQRAR